MTAPTTITHIVLTQWRPDTPAAALVELRERIGRFPEEIPGTVSVVEGTSVSPEGLEAEFEWGMVVKFVDAHARDGYLVHPAHAPVATLIGQWSERVVVYDIGASPAPHLRD